VQVGLELLQALELAGHQLADRDAGARGDTAATSVSPTARRLATGQLGEPRLERVDSALIGRASS
jgi:hypothetical protein